MDVPFTTEGPSIVGAQVKGIFGADTWDDLLDVAGLDRFEAA